MTTTARPLQARQLRFVRSSRVRQAVGTAAGAFAVIGCGLALFVLVGPEAPPQTYPTPPHVATEVSPGALTAEERAAVAAALVADDARTRRMAVSVALGEAGITALGDPALLHHHGIETWRHPRGR